MESVAANSPIIGVFFCVGIVAAYVLQRRWIRQAWKRGMDAYDRKDFAGVWSSFRYVVKKYPGWASARRMLARGLAGLGKHDEAEQELRLAAQLEPRNADGHLDLAVFLAARARDRHEEAVACVETVLEVAPERRAEVATLPQLRALHENQRFRDLAGLPDVEIPLARLN